MKSEYFDISGCVYLEHFVTFGVRVDMTEYAFLEVARTESYDFETHDGIETFRDFELQSFERHIVEGVTAHGGGPQLD